RLIADDLCFCSMGMPPLRGHCAWLSPQSSRLPAASRPFERLFCPVLWITTRRSCWLVRMWRSAPQAQVCDPLFLMCARARKLSTVFYNWFGPPVKTTILRPGDYEVCFGLICLYS